MTGVHLRDTHILSGSARECELSEHLLTSTCYRKANFLGQNIMRSGCFLQMVVSRLMLKITNDVSVVA